MKLTLILSAVLLAGCSNVPLAQQNAAVQQFIDQLNASRQARPALAYPVAPTRTCFARWIGNQWQTICH